LISAISPDWHHRHVKRVIVVGPGAAGKSTLAACLGEITGLPVIELDKLFCRPGLAATPREEWTAIQRQLAAQDGSPGFTAMPRQRRRPVLISR
jgi:Isopentenyl transferase